MTTTIPSCICSMGLLVWILLLVSVYADIEISLSAPSVTEGSSVTITCSLPRDSNRTAQALLWFLNSDQLPASTYSAINKTVSQLSLINVTHSNDGGMYYCCLAVDGDCSGTRLSVGVPPGPVRDFKCISRNIIEYWCEWKPGAETHLTVTYQFFFRGRFGRSKQWKECSDYSTKGSNTCYIPGPENYGSQQYMKIVSTNALGTHEDEGRKFSFSPDSQTIPNPPTDVEVIASDDKSTTIHVSWGIPDDYASIYDNGKMLRYKIRYKADSGASNDWQERFSAMSSRRSAVLDDLKPFTLYCIQVAAITVVAAPDSSYLSDWSPMKRVMTKEAAPSDSVRVNINGMSDNPGNESLQRDVFLQWDDIPTEKQNGIILGYVLYIRKANDIESTPKVYSTNRTSITIKGLDKYSEYVIYTHAFNQAGAGPNSTCRIPDLTTSPGPPEDVRADALSPSTILVKWRKPSSPNGYIISYTIQWKEPKQDRTEQNRNKQNWEGTISIHLSSRNTSYQIHNLKPYTLYMIRIQAHTLQAGDWKENGHLLRTMEGDLLKPPPSVKVTAVTGSFSQLQISWKTPQDFYTNGKVLGYVIYGCRTENIFGSDQNCTDVIFVKSVTDVSSTKYIVDDLRPFTSYHIWMAACSSLGPGQNTTQLLATTNEGIPTAPVDVTVTGITAASISLSWLAPLEPNGIIQHYILAFFKNNQQEVQHYINKTQFTVSDLQGHQIFTFHVQACTTNQPCGPFSLPVTGQTYIGAPDKPTSLDIKGLALNKMHLSWSPPQEINGPIEYYIIAHKPTISTQWSEREERSTNLTLQVHCGWEEDGIMFDIKVTAVSIDEERNALRGAPAMGELELCQSVPASLALPIIIAVSIVVIGVILIVMFFRVRRADVFKDHLPEEPRFLNDTKMLKVLSNGWPSSVIEREVFDEPLSKRQSQTSLETETFDSVGNTESHSGQMKPPWGSLEKIKPIPDTMKLLLTRSDSTDSGVPPSPCNHSNDRDPMTVSLLPSLSADFMSISGSKFVFDSASSSELKSNILRVDDKNAMLFCNGGYIHQESSQTDRFGSISLEPNNNLPEYITESTCKNWNSEANDALLASKTDKNANDDGASAIKRSFNGNGDSASTMNRNVHGNDDGASAINRNFQNENGKKCLSSEESSTMLVPSQHPPINTESLYLQASSDGVVSVPYFQVGLFSKSTLVPFPRSGIQTNHPVSAEDENVSSNHLTCEDYLSHKPADDFDTNMTVMSTQDCSNKNKCRLITDPPHLDNTYVSKKEDLEVLSCPTDPGTCQLLQSHHEDNRLAVPEFAQATSHLSMFMQSCASGVNCDDVDSIESNLNSGNLFHCQPSSETEDNNTTRPSLVRLTSSCSSTAYICVSQLPRENLDKSKLRRTDSTCVDVTDMTCLGGTDRISVDETNMLILDRTSVDEIDITTLDGTVTYKINLDETDGTSFDETDETSLDGTCLGRADRTGVDETDRMCLSGTDRTSLNETDRSSLDGTGSTSLVGTDTASLDETDRKKLDGTGITILDGTDKKGLDGTSPDGINRSNLDYTDKTNLGTDLEGTDRMSLVGTNITILDGKNDTHIINKRDEASYFPNVLSSTSLLGYVCVNQLGTNRQHTEESL